MQAVTDTKRVVVGVDLDNTIIRYDALFHHLAVDQGLVTAGVPPSKKQIRDRIRELEDGDIAWQKLQAEAYGPRIGEAEVFDGVTEFLLRAHEAGTRAFIVSHKTEFASYGNPSISLRKAAMGFLRERGVLDYLAGGDSDVFFASTRVEKCKLIGTLNCNAFIDDLIETFEEPAFPSTVDKILFDPTNASPANNSVRRFRSWSDITNHVFA